jgi:branched-chain amino acid transport system permease protein
MDAFFSALWSGLMIGSLYAIMAIGLTVIYGVSRVFNFAHGHVAVLGGYVAWLVAVSAGAGLALGVGATVLSMALFGWLLYQFTIRILLKRDEWAFATLIFTLGLAILIEFGLLEAFGPRVKSIPQFFSGGISPWFGNVSYHDISLFVVAILLMAFVWAFMTRTTLGRAMRAVSSSPEGARVVGIDINRVFGFTFAFAFILTGISGILLGTHSFMTPGIGWDWMIKGFIIVVFGGLGNVPGAIVAAFALGIIETMVTLYAGALWIWPAWLAVFIVVLSVRPQGILGGRDE